mgnify:CR=1 FL=1
MRIAAALCVAGIAVLLVTCGGDVVAGAGGGNAGDPPGTFTPPSGTDGTGGSGLPPLKSTTTNRIKCQEMENALNAFRASVYLTDLV